MFWLMAAALASPTGDPVEVLQEHTAAWNAGDLDTFCASYAEDAVFLSPSGVTRGRDAVLQRYKKRYPDKAAMGTLTLETLDVRRDGKVATIAARWHLDREPEDASGLTLVVLEQREGTWLVVQDASM